MNKEQIDRGLEELADILKGIQWGTDRELSDPLTFMQFHNYITQILVSMRPQEPEEKKEVCFKDTSLKCGCSKCEPEEKKDWIKCKYCGEPLTEDHTCDPIREVYHLWKDEINLWLMGNSNINSNIKSMTYQILSAFKTYCEEDTK